MNVYIKLHPICVDALQSHLNCLSSAFVTVAKARLLWTDQILLKPSTETGKILTRLIAYCSKLSPWESGTISPSSTPMSKSLGSTDNARMGWCLRDGRSGVTKLDGAKIDRNEAIGCSAFPLGIRAVSSTLTDCFLRWDWSLASRTWISFSYMSRRREASCSTQRLYSVGESYCVWDSARPPGVLGLPSWPAMPWNVVASGLETTCWRWRSSLLSFLLFCHADLRRNASSATQCSYSVGESYWVWDCSGWASAVLESSSISLKWIL